MNWMHKPHGLAATAETDGAHFLADTNLLTGLHFWFIAPADRHLPWINSADVVSDGNGEYPTLAAAIAACENYYARHGLRHTNPPMFFVQF